MRPRQPNQDDGANPPNQGQTTMAFPQAAVLPLIPPSMSWYPIKYVSFNIGDEPAAMLAFWSFRYLIFPWCDGYPPLPPPFTKRKTLVFGGELYSLYRNIKTSMTDSPEGSLVAWGFADCCLPLVTGNREVSKLQVGIQFLAFSASNVKHLELKKRYNILQIYG